MTSRWNCPAYTMRLRLDHAGSRAKDATVDAPCLISALALDRHGAGGSGTGSASLREIRRSPCWPSRSCREGEERCRWGVIVRNDQEPGAVPWEAGGGRLALG